jgi:protein-tyrosine phosphatase
VTTNSHVSPEGRMPATRREVHFEQGFNMRDLGGLTTASGMHVRPHRVYRADDPFLLSRDDLVHLRGMGIDTAIDLRTSEEIADRGSAIWTELGVTHQARPLTAVLPPDEERGKYVEPAWTAALYQKMLDEGRSGHRALWDTMRQASGGRTVIHCASGRDRTGVVVALLLGLLGIDEEQIINDYALSAPGMERMLAWLTANEPGVLATLARSDSAVAAMIVTPPEAMRLFLDAFASTYGGFEGYAEQLGIDGLVPELRANLLEG